MSVSIQIEKVTLGACVAWGHAAFAVPSRGRLAVFETNGDCEVVLGRFGAGDGHLLVRASGGAPLQVGRALYVGLAFERTDPLVADATIVNFLNRYVRPLRQALSYGGRPVAYFGRDWLSLGGRPVAQVGFAHDDHHALFEGWISLSGSLWQNESRASFRAKLPTSISKCDPDALARSIVNTYLKTFARENVPAVLACGAAPTAAQLRRPYRFDAEAPCAIGSMSVSVQGGRVLLGGDWMADEDGVRRVEASIEGVLARGRKTDLETLAAELSLPALGLFGVESPLTYAEHIIRTIDDQQR